jgi:hypothetical protein
MKTFSRGIAAIVCPSQLLNTALAHYPKETTELRDLGPHHWLGGWASIAQTRNVERSLRVRDVLLLLKTLGSR